MFDRGIPLAAVALLMVAARPSHAADPTPTITLGPRTACVTPSTARQARADGGIINVDVLGPNVVAANLTGTVAANAFLGCPSAATQTFHLEQELIIEGASAGDRGVTLVMESSLVGLVRARHRGGAAATIASAKVCPAGAPDSPLVMVHPIFGVVADGGRLCNQRLPKIKVPAMPPGLYILSADFVLTSDAAGLADGHSAADFSPSTALPADWVRSRDPFQGVDKKDFGFHVVLTAETDAAGLEPAATTSISTGTGTATTRPGPAAEPIVPTAAASRSGGAVKRAILTRPARPAAPRP